MKRIVLTIIILFTLLQSKAQTKNFIDQPYIEINGNADTAITPDEIYIKIIISERDTKDKVSVEEQETKMVTALQSLGINTGKDLTANDIGSNFRYYLLKSKDILKTKQYILKVSDAVITTKVIGQLEDLGISNTSIDHIDYSKMEELKNLLKTKAVENAKAQALAFVKPLNQNLGGAIYIGENTNSLNNMLAGSAAGITIRGYSSAKRQAVELPSIDFEKIKVEAKINVKFILK